jgi:glycosyltransferase involved in cell wall biosynthesis
MASGTVSVSEIDWLKREAEYDVIHLFGGSSNWYDIAYHIPKRIKLVVTALGAQTPFGALAGLKSFSLNFINYLTHNRTVHDRASFVLRTAAAIICLSDVEREFFHRRYNINEDKLHVIPNSVPDDWGADIEHATSEVLGFLPEIFSKGYILYIGTITKRKNPLKLLRACKILGVPVIIVGKSIAGEEHYFSRVLAELHCYGDMGLYLDEVLYGSLFHKGLIKSSLVLCLPSSSETQPLVLLEGLALGCKTLCGDGAYSQQQLFEKAFKCNVNSVESIADTINFVLRATAPVGPTGVICHSEAATKHIELYEGLL